MVQFSAFQSGVLRHARCLDLPESGYSDPIRSQCRPFDGRIERLAGLAGELLATPDRPSIDRRSGSVRRRLAAFLGAHFATGPPLSFKSLRFGFQRSGFGLKRLRLSSTGLHLAFTAGLRTPSWTNPRIRPTPPAIIRMIPTVSRLTWATSTFMANLRIAPMTIRRMLAPMVISAPIGSLPDSFRPGCRRPSPTPATRPAASLARRQGLGHRSVEGRRVFDLGVVGEVGELEHGGLGAELAEAVEDVGGGDGSPRPQVRARWPGQSRTAPCQRSAWVARSKV